MFFIDDKEKYEHWKDIARYDIETAEAMLHSGRYLYVVFMCQQAIEKLVKGLYVLYKSEEPPRTHNIYSIFKTLFDMQNSKNQQFNETAQNYIPFFAQLLAYYISERYPSYKEKLSKTITQDKAQEVLNLSREVFQWLQSLER